MISHAAEDYLKAIYKIGATGRPVTTNAIAERMGVSQASATGMIKKLAELKLIRHTPYRGVELTAAGRKVALEIIRHHRLLELYLAQALGYSWDQVHDEAEKLEHVISEEFERRMAEFLGHPTTDPHGAPIPSKDGEMIERDLFPLSESEAGQTVRIEQVSDRDPEMLRYLGSLGIYPQVEIEVLEKGPFDGPLRIRLRRRVHHLGQRVTDNVLVSKVRRKR